MYLRDLAVYASDLAGFPQGFTCGDFNLSTHTPVEAYLESLPRRKVVLGDLAKVNVVIGPRLPGQKAYFAASNVAIACWPWFDFRRYFSLSREGQQCRIIAVLHKTLLRIARRTNSATGWYETAFAALARRSFPLPEITELELRRRTGLLSPRKKSALKCQTGTDTRLKR